MTTMRDYQDALRMLLRDIDGQPVRLSGVELARVVIGSQGRDRPEPKEVWMGSMTLLQSIKQPPKGFVVNELEGSTLTVQFRRDHHVCSKIEHH